jgi:uncharacterized membrane protein
MSGFRKALLWTAGPIVAMSLISTAGNLVRNAFIADATAWLWLAAVVYGAGAAIASIVFAIAGRKQISAGMAAGLAIGIISLAGTCFANIRLMFGP